MRLEARGDASGGPPARGRRRSPPRAARATRPAGARTARRGTPSTTVPYIWTRRRYASQAKRASPVSAARPSTVCAFSPMLRTVSIIPGIENLAPERQETRSGLAGSPSRLPVRDSSVVQRGDLLLPEPPGPVARLQEGAAGLGGDGEARRHRQPEPGHLRQVGPLAAEEGLDLVPGLRRPLHLRQLIEAKDEGLGAGPGGRASAGGGSRRGCGGWRGWSSEDVSCLEAVPRRFTRARLPCTQKMRSGGRGGDVLGAFLREPRQNHPGWR